MIRWSWNSSQVNKNLQQLNPVLFCNRLLKRKSRLASPHSISAQNIISLGCAADSNVKLVAQTHSLFHSLDPTTYPTRKRRASFEMREERMRLSARGRSFIYMYTYTHGIYYYIYTLTGKCGRKPPRAWERRRVLALIFDINSRNPARFLAMCICSAKILLVVRNLFLIRRDSRRIRLMKIDANIIMTHTRREQDVWPACKNYFPPSGVAHFAQKWFSPEFNCEHAPKLPLSPARTVDEWNGREKKVRRQEVGCCRSVFVCAQRNLLPKGAFVWPSLFAGDYSRRVNPFFSSRATV